MVLQNVIPEQFIYMKAGTKSGHKLECVLFTASVSFSHKGKPPVLISSDTHFLIALHMVKMGRNSYTVDFKLKAVKRLKGEFEGHLSKASRVLNITKKQLTEWARSEAKFANVKDIKNTRCIGSGQRAKYPLLEEQLLVWFKEQRESKYFLIYKDC